MSLSNYFSTIPASIGQNLYGGASKHELFLKKSEKIIDGIARHIKERANTSTSLVSLFFEIFHALRVHRQTIARDHNTPDAQLFGLLRREGQAKLKVYSTTSSTNLYEKYRIQFLRQLIKKMEKIECFHKAGGKPTIKYRESKVNRPVSFEIEVLSRERIIEQNLTQGVTEVELQTALDTEKNMLQIAADFSLREKLRTEHPALYTRQNKITDVQNLQNRWTASRTHFILCNLYIDIEGKTLKLGSHVTWMDMNKEPRRLANMEAESQVLAIHQDTLDIEKTMNAIAKLFTKIIVWKRDGDNIDTLIENIALFRFMYAYCMPCTRGDGAIGDWFELGIYRAHGFTKTCHNSKTLPCYEPLGSTSFSAYLKRYKKSTKVAE